MPTTIRPSGITVETRGGATATGNVKLRRRSAGELPRRGDATTSKPTSTAASTLSPGRRRKTATATATPTPAPLTEEEALINAIEDDDVELLDAFPIGAPPAIATVDPATPETVTRGKKRRTTTDANVASNDPASVDLNIPLADGESAVVLIEKDGVYEWHVTGEVTDAPPPPPAPPGKRRRRTTTTNAAPVATRSARFTITLAPDTVMPAGTAATWAKRRKLGMVKKYLIGQAIAYVFKFIAKPIVAGVARFQERNVVEGLVHINGTDPSKWETLADSAKLPLPSSRAAKVLLMVHGTFSSTTGSFGSLAAHEQGLAFLQGALAQYDLILGFDHKTITASPKENAVDIITRLNQLGFTKPPTVDAIAFSRGGLVLRSLIEELLPSHPDTFAIRRAVFVACTNGGTELANPNNWNRFVTRYTNLAAAGARIVSYIPQFTHGALIFGEAVKGLGAFLKALVRSAKTDDVAPGLEAMDPNGFFVNLINQVQPGQPALSDTYYCAITSDFDPDTAAKDLDPNVLPPGVLLRIGDKLTDELYGKPNDLVVHVDSMTHIDPSVGEFVRDRLDFGTNGHVFHTTYFHQTETADALIRWFNVTPPKPIVATAVRRTARSADTQVATGKPVTKTLASTAASKGGYVGAVANSPSRVIMLRSTMLASAALARVVAAQEPWVVIERNDRDDHGKPVRYYYAHTRSAALDMLLSPFITESGTVHEAFNLRETKASDTVANGSAPAPKSIGKGTSVEVLNGSFGSSFRSVVIGAEREIQVVPAVEDDVLLGGMRDSGEPPNDGAEPRSSPPIKRGRVEIGSHHVPTPKTILRGGVTRGISPMAAVPKSIVPGGHPVAFGKPVRRGVAKNTAAAPSTRSPSTKSPPTQSSEKKSSSKPATADVALHVRAATDDEFVQDRPTVVAVTLSREELAAITAGVQETRTTKVKAAVPLVVECLPMKNSSMLNEGDGRVEIPVPPAGEPTELRFDVVGREPGDALIKVQVRQGPLPLVTLSLVVSVVPQRSGARKEVVSTADVASFPAIPAATNELRIVQMSPTKTSSQYRFELRLPTKRVQQEFVTTELTTDADSYINNLYTRIEDRWTQYGSEKDAFARDLRAIGSELFDQLLPLELRQLLWKHRDAINSVQVISSEPFIPWELVCLRDPAQRKPSADSAFLGELGVVRWLMHGYPPEQLTISEKQTRYVIPDYAGEHELPEAQEERDMVTSRFNATPITPEAESIYALVSEPGNFDLLHIACHGTADSANIGAAHLEMPGKIRSDGSPSDESVRAETVRYEAQLFDESTGKQPIVVLNACQSARAGYGLKGIGGFAEAFVAGGAGVFIGSSWSVGDVPARAFIEEFYAQFLSGKSNGASLSEAVAKARAKARADGDATWLAYVVYGHPRAVARLVP